MAAKGRQANRQNRPRNQQEGESQANREVLEALGLDETIKAQRPAPSTVESLMRNRRTIEPEYRNDYGMASSLVELSPEGFHIKVAADSEPIKYNPEAPGDLTTKEALRNETIVYDKVGKANRAHGRMAVELVPVLLIGETAYGWHRKGDRDREGMGSNWPLQDLPSHELAHDILKEFLLIGTHKKTGKKVLLAPPTADGRQDDWVREAKKQVLEGLEGELGQAIGNEKVKSDDPIIRELNRRSQDLTKVNEVVTVKFDDLSKQFGKVADKINFEINGHQEKTTGLVRIDEATNTLQITKPARLDMDAYDIQLFDATGQNRQIVEADASKHNQFPELRTILESVAHRPRVQTSPGGPVYLPKNHIETTRIRKPFAVIPQFIFPRGKSSH